MALLLSLLVAGALGAVLTFTIGLVSRESRERAVGELEAARTAFYSLLESRAASAHTLTTLVTELPIFRAHLVDTRLAGDRATVELMADGYRQQLNAAFALVTDRDGRWLASPGWPASESAPPALAAAVATARRGARARLFFDRGDALYLVVAAPARFADEVLGTFVVGYELTDALAQELARLAQCEVLLLAGSRIAATSLRERSHTDTLALAARASSSAVGVLPELARIGAYRYVGGTFLLAPDDGLPAPGRLVLLADWQPTQVFVDQLRDRFLLGGLVVFVLALAGGLVFSRRVSEPLREIAAAATDIASGNLSMELKERGSAEAVTVAKAFNEMSASLRAAQHRLMHDAIHDPLTRLPNRVLFMERLNRALSRRVRHPDYFFAVLFVDLDRFKHVNDSLGHAAGDQMLIAFSERLAATVRRDDVVSRMSMQPRRRPRRTRWRASAATSSWCCSTTSASRSTRSASPSASRRWPQSRCRWTRRRCLPAPASAWRSARTSIAPPTSCCGMRTWRCTGPRPPAAAVTRCSTRPCTTRPWSGCGSRPSCGARSSGASSASGTSRSCR